MSAGTNTVGQVSTKYCLTGNDVHKKIAKEQGLE